MTIKKAINGKMLIILTALTLTACAGDKEFETIPQKGANRTGVFPSFTQRPHAETAQFTQTERDELANKLIQNRNMVERNAPKADYSAKYVEQQKKETTKAAEETLHKIEQSN